MLRKAPRVRQHQLFVCFFADGKSACSNQCHKLGIESFINKKGRPSLIPILVNYFESREMSVKFHQEVAETKNLPGSGAQGAILGNQQFLGQTNNIADCIPKKDRLQFIDDLSVLGKSRIRETKNLLTYADSSTNTKNIARSQMAASKNISSVVKVSSCSEQKTFVRNCSFD